MAADNKANYSKIGFFVLAGIVAIIGTLVYIAGFDSKKNEFFAETYFTNPVSGLGVGSAVNFRGVKIGMVKRISFIGAEYDKVVSSEDRQKIYVLLSLDKRIFHQKGNADPEAHLARFVEKGLHATVSASGITGMSNIELNYPKTSVEDKPISWTPEYVVIPPAPSILQSAADSLTRILNQIDRMDLNDTWSNVVQTTANANALLGNINDIIDSQKGNVSAIMDDLRDAATNIKDFSNEIRANPASLIKSSNAPVLDETL